MSARKLVAFLSMSLVTWLVLAVNGHAETNSVPIIVGLDADMSSGSAKSGEAIRRGPSDLESGPIRQRRDRVAENPRPGGKAVRRRDRRRVPHPRLAVEHVEAVHLDVLVKRRDPVMNP